MYVRSDECDTVHDFAFVGAETITPSGYEHRGARAGRPPGPRHAGGSLEFDHRILHVLLVVVPLSRVVLLVRSR